MMSQWKTVTIADLGDVVGGGTPSTRRASYYQGSIPWLTPKDLSDYPYRRIRCGARSITQEGLLSCSARLLPPSTVLFTSRAPIGYVAIAETRLCTNQGFKSVIPHSGTDPLFLYYLLLYNRERIEAMGSGTTFKEISGAAMKAIQVRVPLRRAVQEQIAAVLSALDDKIELNLRMTGNLQQQAAALFRRWFIDSPEACRWHTGVFSQLLEAAIGGDWGRDAPSGRFTQPVRCIRGTDLSAVRQGTLGRMPTRYIPPKSFADKHLAAGDIVVELSGGSPTQSTGRAAVVLQPLLERCGQQLICTNFCRILRPAAGCGMFVYHYWQYLYDRQVFFAYENGTTGIKNLDLSAVLSAHPIVIPPAPLLQRFDRVCQPLYARLAANGQESERLTALRDLLLPALMSGKIDVSAVRCAPPSP